jgi:hypothetical protein
LAVHLRDASLELDHVTVANRGGGGQDAAVAVDALAGDGSATLHAVALAGYSHGITRTVATGHQFPVSVDHSVWDPSHDLRGGAAAGSFTELGNAQVEPALVDRTGGDLRPRGGSALVDRDALTNPAIYADADGVTTVDGDGDGNARPDAGGLEYRRSAPQVDAVNVPTSGSPGNPLAFAASASDADGDRVQLAWEFGDGAVGAGTATSHAYAAAGTYAVTLTAIDEAGESTKRSFTVTVGAGDGARAGAALARTRLRRCSARSGSRRGA